MKAEIAAEKERLRLEKQVITFFFLRNLFYLIAQNPESLDFSLSVGRYVVTQKVPE